MFFRSIILLILCTSMLSGFAQDGKIKDRSPKTLTRILFLFDASQSMYGLWQSDIKINAARKVLSHVLDTLSTMENVEAALRVYGHQFNTPPQVCDDTKLEVPFGKDNFQEIIDKLDRIQPRGTSPIAYSLDQATTDFPDCPNCRNIVVLITDGIEECEGDPCEVSRRLQKAGVVLKPFVIGIGTNFEDAFECVGEYFDASSEIQFSQALNSVIYRALNPTTATVNLIDAYGKATETNVNMSFYDHTSGFVQRNYIHTMNHLGIPDTIVLDPIIVYDVVVHTLPPVRKDNIKILAGQHNTIGIKVPQGYLKLAIGKGGAVARGLQCIIRKEGSIETVNVQDFGFTEKYLTGTYNLEVLSLPRLYIDDVKISQGYTTTVEVPVPGIAVIQKNTKGYGSIFVEKDGQLEWVYNFQGNDPNQVSLILMPGNYTAVFRSKYVDRSIYTIEQEFKVKSGMSTNVRLF